MAQPIPTAHHITITPHPARVTVRLNGQTVAETTRALNLREGSLRPVLYIPREDANMAYFTRSETTTHCPFKGDASYYSLAVDGETATDAVWTYESPFPDVAAIKGHLAFYPHLVDIIIDDESA